MLKAHSEAFPRANYVGTEDVTMRRLDSVTAEMLQPNDVGFSRSMFSGI